MANRETIWRVTLLGKVQAERTTAVIERFQTQKTLLLLALLARQPGQKLRREALIDTLWPDVNLDVGRNRLNQAIAWLRKNLEIQSSDKAQVILSERSSISVDPAALESDVQLFLIQIESARKATNQQQKLEHLTSALNLYGGELLPGCDDRWVSAERLRLEEININALTELSELYSKHHDYYNAIFFARKAVDADPLLEDSHEQLIRTLIAAGQPNAALRQYASLCETLRISFDASPSTVTASLVEKYRSQTVKSIRPKYFSPTPLIMPITRFIGRSNELAQASASLESNVRLLTFIGIGGSGKTRLALETASRVQKNFKNHILFVHLADIPTSGGITSAIADALQLPRLEETSIVAQITDALSESRFLLVLDNAEHLLPDLSIVVRQLLSLLPLLSILVTSRQELSLDGELIQHIAPLETPSKDDARTKTVESESVKLFVDRVKNVRPSFELLDSNIETVAALCRGLEGIPLAIELCAAWAHTLNASQMLEKLLRRFDLLVSNKADIVPRHRSLRAAIEYSIRQLTPELQQFFAQISVFRGGWTLEAIESVHTSLSDTSTLTTLVALAELRSRSLVEVDDRGSAMRYRMLESLREFGISDLSAEDTEKLNQAHAAYFANLATIADEKFQGPSQYEWAARLDQERKNITTALEWCLKAGRVDIALTIAIHLTSYWKMRGKLQEASYWLTTLLSNAGENPEPNLHASALAASGFVEWSMGNFGRAVKPHNKALKIRESLGDKAGISESLYYLGITAYRQDQWENAAEYLSRSLSISEADSNQKGVARALLNLGNIALSNQSQIQARAYYERSLIIEQKRGDIRRVADSLSNIGITYGSENDFQRAKSYFEQSVAIRRELTDDYGLASDLFCLGKTVFCQKDFKTFLELIIEGLQTAFDTQNKYILTQFFVTISLYYLTEREYGKSLYFLCCYSKIRTDMEMNIESPTAADYTEINATLRNIIGDEHFTATENYLRNLSLRKLNQECIIILTKAEPLPSILNIETSEHSKSQFICPHCGSSTLVRFGKNHSGRQRLRCKTCTRVVTENHNNRPFPGQRKEEILVAYRRHILSQREIARQFHISRNTLADWIKHEKSSPSAKA